MKKVYYEITQCRRGARKDLMPRLDHSMDGAYNLGVMGHDTGTEITQILTGKEET